MEILKFITCLLAVDFIIDGIVILILRLKGYNIWLIRNPRYGDILDRMDNGDSENEEQDD